MSYEDYITIFSANHQQVKSFTECKKKFNFLCPNLLQDVGLPISALSRAKKSSNRLNICRGARELLTPCGHHVEPQPEFRV